MINFALVTPRDKAYVAEIAVAVIIFFFFFFSCNNTQHLLLGLVFPKTLGSSTVYFLRGIVSTGGNKGGSCDNDKYSLFTNVQYHIEMVQYYETQNRPK